MKKYYIYSIIVLMIFIIFINFILKLKNEYSLNNIIKTNEDFNFFVAADTHFLSKKMYDDGETFQNLFQADDKLTFYSVELFESLIENIKLHKPEFVIFLGDLTFSGSKQSHVDFAKKLTEIENDGINVFVIPGNHDIMNKNAKYFFQDKTYSAEIITKEHFLNIYNEFGYKDALLKDSSSLSYLAAPSENIWFLMLDTTMEYPKTGGYIKETTLNWIEECYKLSINNNVKLIAVMHHSLIDHSKIINEDYTITNSKEAIEIFNKCNINLVLTGHIHIQDIKTLKIKDYILYDIATSSLCVYPHQFGKIYYTKKNGFKYITEKLNMKQYALNNNIKDENLIDFENYSAEFFKDKCCKNQKKCILELSELKKKKKMNYLKLCPNLTNYIFLVIEMAL